ncbi:MAG: MBL fold metallo-hydrolase [Acidobacteriota bacterium]
MIQKSLKTVLFLLFVTASAFAAENFRLEKVSESVYATIPVSGGMAFANSTFIVLDDGILVVDSQSSRELSEEVIAMIKKTTDKPIKYLVNTHFHGDHIAGNTAFSPDVRLIVHPRTLDRFTQDKVPANYPIITVTAEMDFVYPGKKVQILWMGRGHTEGDLIVYVPGEEVIITGDLFFNQIIPYAKDSHIGQWLATIQRIMLNLKFQKIIPGHGEVSGLTEFRQFRELLAWAKAVADAEIKKGTMREKIIERAKETELYKTRIVNYRNQEGLSDLLDIAFQEIQRSRGNKQNVQQ